MLKEPAAVSRISASPVHSPTLYTDLGYNVKLMRALSEQNAELVYVTLKQMVRPSLG
jgi:hypothetical protein